MPLERASERLRRILVLVPWVMANAGATVDEVCARFGVTPDQLSADLEMLFMCGLPPFGPGDLIVAYIEGDRIEISMADYLAEPPPLTRDEALGLLVTGRALERLPDFEHADSLRRALMKIADALAPEEAARAQELAERISLELEAPGADLLGDLRAAVEANARLRVSYFSAGRAEMTEREIDPLLVMSQQGEWYVIAYDHRTGERRPFRVDRFRDIERTGESFEPPEDFDAAAWESKPLFHPSPRDLRAVIDVSPQAAWLAEFVHAESEFERANGWTRLTIRTSQLPWLVRLLLNAGPGARAVSPPELVDELRKTVEATLARYGDQPAAGTT